MAIIVITGGEQRKRSHEYAVKMAQNINQSLCAMHRGVSSQAKAILEALAHTSMVESRDTAACAKIFASLLKDHAEFTNIILIGMDGKVAASGQPELTGADVADRKYFRDALITKNFSAGDYVRDRADGAAIQVFALPLADTDGRIQGVIALAFAMRAYKAFLGQSPLPPSARVTFVDYKGTSMLSYPENALRADGSPFNIKYWDKIANGASDAGTFEGERLTGEQGFYVYSRLRMSPQNPFYMTVIVSFSDDDIFAEVRALLYRNALLVALATALALVVAWIIGKKLFTQDLDQLTEVADRLGKGHLSSRVPDGMRCKEMRQLSATFNTMAQALESRQAELQETTHSLEKMRGMLDGILESMPSALICLDKRDRISLWNHAAEQLCTAGSQQALGRKLKDVCPWLHSQMGSADPLSPNSPPKLLERRQIPGQDDLAFADILIYPLAGNGLKGAVVRVDDVTKRVQMESFMIQTEKMSSIGSLAGGMAHEINNPLSGILQSIQIIQRRLSPALAANSQAAMKVGTTLEAVRDYLESRAILEFLETIKESSERAAKIIKNMLGFIRKDSTGHVPMQLAELVDRAVELAGTDYDLKKKYDFRKIEIIREYTSGLPLMYCSPTDIEQVIYNLLSNAAHAMASAPDPHAPPRLTLRIRNEGSHGVIEVEDNGPGMDENVRKRVFEPLFTTKPPGEGTGLGLTVSYFIVVNTYGGTIRVDSVKGTGTRFIISLPLGPDQQPGNRWAG
jgi:signal transduction histidine kinase/HAMP domain-containing protein